MIVVRTLLRSVTLFASIALVPWNAIGAQYGSRVPAAQTPRVAVIAAFDDSAPYFAVSIANAAPQRIQQLVSRDRVWLVSKKDIDNLFVVIAGIVPTRMAPIDTVHFRASAPEAAVDSVVARLLANPRLRRGGTPGGGGPPLGAEPTTWAPAS